MNLGWILSPLTQYAVIFAGLLACLVLFISAKAEVAKIRREYLQYSRPADVDIQALADEVARLNRATTCLNETPNPAFTSGLTQTKRTQVMRMHHRGESVDTIAGALQLQGSEVALIVKLHRVLDRNG